MAVFGGVVGVLIGSFIVIVIAEWVWVDWFSHHDALETLLFAVLAGGGAFVGSRLIPRLFGRRRHAAS